MSIENIIERLDSLKIEIEKAKTEKARSEGTLQQLWKSLQEKYQIKDIEHLQKQIKVLENDKYKTEKAIETAYKKLEKEYSW